MPLHIPDPLFRGVTSVKARRVLGLILPHKIDGVSLAVRTEKWLVPCAGQFSIPEMLVGLGIAPDRIWTSDITLFSSVLGYLADVEKNVAELQFAPASVELKNILGTLPSSEIELAATILYAIKWVQLSSKKDFYMWQRKSLEVERERVLSIYGATLETYKKKMSGMHYDIRDAFVHVKQEAENNKCVVWFNPPGYKGGYTKMFDAHGQYSWAEPHINELDPDKNDAFLVSLTDVPAHVLVYSTEGHAVDGLPESWQAIFSALNEKQRKKSYVMSNKSLNVGVVVRSKLKDTQPKHALFDDHTITAESKVSMVRCSKEDALYYYDLFVRELGMVKAEIYYLFCIDGQVAGTCGFFFRDWMMKRSSALFETFGLSMTSLRYARLGRLLMTTITCEEFKEQFVAETLKKSTLQRELTTLKTTCLTKYPEAKKNRGILKLTHRERMPNGRFYLSYETAWHKKTYQGIISEWVEKHANYERLEGKDED
jgi:hypothetical protein